MRALLLALVLAGAAWSAHSSDAVIGWDSAASTILVAHDNRIEAFGREGVRRLWRVDGLPHPSAIAISSDGVTAAVIDSLSDRVVLVDVPSGRSVSMVTGATPVEGQFVGSAFYLLDRDSARIERIGADHSRSSIAVAPDPAFMRRSGRFLYVYGRSAGSLEEIDSSSDQVVRSVGAGASASGLELDGSFAYLVYPRRGKIELINLKSMHAAGDIPVGAVPTDVALLHQGTAITASRLAVSDPAAKRVWQVEGGESQTKAIARGFLRGAIGLGLYKGRNDQYPTGIDRLVASGTTVLAYDSSSRTLYREVKGKPITIGTGLGPASFAITADSIVTWKNGALHRQVR